MRIDNLKKGTKLMWEAKGEFTNGEKYHYVYPITIGSKHPRHPRLVSVSLPSGSQYMGPEDSNIRKPTTEELNTLNWE